MDTAMTNAKDEQKLTDVVLMKNRPVVQSQLLLAIGSRACTTKLLFQPENPLQAFNVVTFNAAGNMSLCTQAQLFLT